MLWASALGPVLAHACRMGQQVVWLHLVCRVVTAVSKPAELHAA